MRFIKNGNFSKTFNSGADLNRSVRYIRTQNAEEIFIGDYINSNSIQISFKTLNNDVLNLLINESRKLNLEVSDLDSIFLIHNLKTIKICTMNKESLSSFLQLIKQALSKFGEPIEKETLQEIYQTLNLSQISHYEYFLDEMKQLIDQSQEAEVLERVKSFDDINIMLDLGKHCEEIGESKKAVNFYKLVPKENKEFPDANYHAAHLLLQIADDEKEDEDACTARTKDIVSLMLNAPVDLPNQRFIDIVYHRLSGGEGLTPEITDIRPNTATLFALADQTKSLAEENKELHSENQILHDEIKKLKLQLRQQKMSQYQAGIFKESRNSNDEHGFEPANNSM